MTMDRFTSEFDRIFGELGYQLKTESITDEVAQFAVESGTHFRAAAKRPALAKSSHEEAAQGAGND